MIAALRGWFGRLLLAAVGLGLLAYLVHGAGPGRVVKILLQAGSWLPVIVGLEVVQLLSDVVALHLLLGQHDYGQRNQREHDEDQRMARQVPPSTWVRSSAVAYAMMVLLPAGRAAGEVARATLVARHVGTGRAATASAELQASYLTAIALSSAAACAVVSIKFGLHTPLALLLAGNALMMTFFTVSLFAVLWDARAGRWMTQLRQRFGDHTPPIETPRVRRVPLRAMLVCASGRGAQLVQYGVLLSAVGGTASIGGAFIAHGIHLVGATLGDAVPNQLGVVDGTYRTFAPALGFGDAPARALSIAFLAHAAQLAMAGICVVVAALTRQNPERETTPPSLGVRARS
jgi:hypothetical protein